MSSKIIWFNVQLELLGISNSYSVEAVKDLQDDLDMRPHLRNPRVSWDDHNQRILVHVDAEGVMDENEANRMAKEAADQIAEELLEAASGSLREFKSITVHVLDVKY
jgi:hypothetical protein